MKKKEIDLVWEWERRAFPYYCWIFLSQWRNCRFSLPVYGVIVYKNKVANCYLNLKTLINAGETILRKVEKSSSFLRKWKNFVFKTGKNLHKFCDEIEKLNLDKISDKKLLKIYQKSIKIYLNHTDGVAVIRNSNRALQEKLTQIYKKPELVALLLSTEKRSIMIKEHEELLKIAEVAKKEKSKERVEKLLKRHTRKYFYLPCGYSDESPFSLDDFKRKLKEILKSKKSWKDFKEKFNQNIKERKRIISQLKPSLKIKRLIEFGSTCTYFKDFIRGNLNRLQYQNRRIFEQIAKRTNNHWEDIACLIPPEIENVLKNKKRVKKRNLAVLFSDKKGVHILLGEKAEKKIREIEKIMELKEINEIKGISANPGKVNGKVLIVKKLTDALGKKDFILVSPMTTPDLMPTIKQAKAIITDEGGLTCHAAIISRELGIPCIIGTKIATKVLKNGDLVEVDAEKGILKILKR